MDLIRDCHDSQQAAAILLEHAKENFSNDNVTVMVIKLNLESNKMDTTS